MYLIIILSIILILLLILFSIQCNIKNKCNYKNQFFSKNDQKNILGTELIKCCNATGFNRDGVCFSNVKDIGTHIICAIVDDNFLQFTKTKGNDLITPSNSFKGLVAGDKWCLCILRWIEAHEAGKAPKIIPESTNELALKYVSKKILMQYAI
jgi:uncharacterized protein (DUF2237 family)